MLLVQGAQVEPPALYRPFLWEETHSPMSSFDKHLLSTYYVLDPMKGTAVLMGTIWLPSFMGAWHRPQPHKGCSLPSGMSGNIMREAGFKARI